MSLRSGTERATVVAALTLCYALAFAPNLGGCEPTAPPPAPHADEAHAAEHPEGGAHHDEHEALPRRLKVAPEVVRDAKLRASPATLEPLSAVIELPGEIAADPDKSASITAPIAGRIERVAFVEGQLVKANDLLAVLRVPEIAEQRAALGSVQARAVAARSSAVRTENLQAQGLASEQQLLDDRARADALEAEARAAADRLRAIDPGVGRGGGARVELRSPIAGTVVSRDAVVGQLADPATPIATVVDMHRLWFLGRVFERDLARISVDQGAVVSVNAYPGVGFSGKIELIGRQIDPIARTVHARVPLDNTDGRLKIGLFGTARIARGAGDASKPSLVVPRSAVTDLGGQTIVFVEQAEGEYEVHDVVLGRSALDKTEVLSGLRAGERVVEEGVFTLKSLVLKSTFGEDEH